MKKDSVDTIIVQTMPYGRNFCIFDDADQQMLGGMFQVATVVERSLKRLRINHINLFVPASC